MTTVGVLGLGIIGAVWSRHYDAAGALAGAWNRTPRPGFPRWMPTPEAVASAADIVQIVVADPPAVRDILGRIAPVLRPGKFVVQSSTIDPVSSADFRALALARGARYIEAPFTGSKPAAEQRQSTFYLGGDAADIAAVDPVLALVSPARLHVGDNAQAATLKLAMNLNIAAQMQALVEALAMARKAGISDEVFFNSLAKNAGYSGLTKLKEPKLRQGDFAPQFSVKHMLKDMRLATAGSGGSLPLLAAVCACLEAAVQAGHADADISVLVRMVKL